MRIKGSTTGSTTGTGSGTKPSLKKGLSALFSQKLQTQSSDIDSYEHEVSELHKEIEAAGDKLAEDPTLTNFKQFRDSLSRLAKRISSEAYRLEKFGGTPQNPRYYEIITVINSEADRLYDLVIRQQRDNLAITAKVIGIKGLVVDLLT